MSRMMPFFLVICMMAANMAWAATTTTIDAERLEFDRPSGKAVFSGKVVLARPDMTLTCTRLESTFGKNANRTMVATGQVVMTKKGGDGEVIKGQRAEYNPQKGTMVVTGNVVLTQGGHNLAGDRLEYDIKTGKARLTGEGGIKANLSEGQTP